MYTAARQNEIFCLFVFLFIFHSLPYSRIIFTEKNLDLFTFCWHFLPLKHITFLFHFVFFFYFKLSLTSLNIRCIIISFQFSIYFTSPVWLWAPLCVWFKCNYENENAIASVYGYVIGIEMLVRKRGKFDK